MSCSSDSRSERRGPRSDRLPRVAVEVTGVRSETIARVAHLDLADSALVSLRLFNEWRWSPMPTIDDAEAAVQAVAAGEWSEARTVSWLRAHLSAPSSRTSPSARPA